MTDVQAAAASAAVPTPQEIIDQILRISPELREANTAVQANSVTAIFGISGGGKSSLCDTAAEYAHERFGGVTLCYHTDPGGFGNKRLSLVRLGIMKVWDPSNHVRPIETMELISLGAWPEEILDPDRGYADPNVRLVLPRRLGFVLLCPSGHQAAKFDTEAAAAAANVQCPTCNLLTTITNTKGVERVIIKSKLFQDVVLRIYDSVSAMNDRGLLIELPQMSARGELPTSNTGGSALGSADAVRQGTAVFGTGSMSQVGFMQNRSYGWLTNIRQIPDQRVPSIATFGVESSKSTDESGGEMLLGLKIAGNARTAAACGWVGNMLHATKEPDEQGRMRFRLWLTNHYDLRDPRKIPYVAKHRGTPLGMPDFLEDPWDDDPKKRAENAWTVCSLKYFFELLEKQFEQQVRADAAKYPNAPALQPAGKPAEDEIIPLATTAGPSTGEIAVPVTGGRTIGRRGVGGRRPTATVVTPAAVPAAVPVAESGAGPAQPAAGGVTTPAPAVVQGVSVTPPPVQPPVHVQQMEATLAAAAAAATSGNAAPAAAAGAVSQAAPVPSVPAPPVATAQPVAHSRIRRVPRPPTT